MSVHQLIPKVLGDGAILHTLARHDMMWILSAEGKAMRRHLDPDTSSGRCKGKAEPECVEIGLYTTTRPCQLTYASPVFATGFFLDAT